MGFPPNCVCVSFALNSPLSGDASPQDISGHLFYPFLTFVTACFRDYKLFIIKIYVIVHRVIYFKSYDLFIYKVNEKIQRKN